VAFGGRDRDPRAACWNGVPIPVLIDMDRRSQQRPATAPQGGPAAIVVSTLRPGSTTSQVDCAAPARGGETATTGTRAEVAC